MSSDNTSGRKASVTTEKDAFLWAVIFSIEGEYTVDWDAVAVKTGMSKGGARNKFNLFKKQNQSIATVGSATAVPATPKKRKAPGASKTPNKKAQAKAQASIDEDHIEEDPTEEAINEEDADDGLTNDPDDEA